MSEPSQSGSAEQGGSGESVAPNSGVGAGTDPELAALPDPRKPWRRATLVALGLTLLLSLALCVSLLDQVDYAFKGGQPAEVGDLAHFTPGPQYENSWVHAQGSLETKAVGYRRPLDDDRFRLARASENPQIWVELREPEDSLGEHFLPPSSFVGRLVPIADPGLRYRSLRAALEASGQPSPPKNAWLLIDGESPASSRWVFGVVLLLLGFAGFSAWSLLRLLAKVPKLAR